MASSYSEFQTTNQHTFVAPQRMPGYGGYCPDVKYGYGQTYGSSTASFFHDYRQRHLSGWRGDDHHRMPFPAVYSDPASIASTRDRSRARWLPHTQAYDVSNSHKSQSEVLDFDRKCQEHREWYQDRSQSMRPVPHFVNIPVPLQSLETENFSRRWLPLKPMASQPAGACPTQFDLSLSGVPGGPSGQGSLHYSNRMSSSRASGSARGSSSRTMSARPPSSRRDRAMRDKVFENRVGTD